MALFSANLTKWFSRGGRPHVSEPAKGWTTNGLGVSGIAGSSIAKTLKNSFVLLALFAGVCLRAETLPEYQVKAAYVYNFARFVEWPAQSFKNAQDPFVIGIFGKDPFGGALEQTLKNKKIHGRAIQILRFDEPAKGAQCHILFIPTNEEKENELIKQIENLPILSIGETDGFVQKHGMIELKIVDQKVAFEIHQTRVEKAGLIPSVQVLKLGKVVR
jgi:hypothetical protein